MAQSRKTKCSREGYVLAYLHGEVGPQLVLLDEVGRAVRERYLVHRLIEIR